MTSKQRAVWYELEVCAGEAANSKTMIEEMDARNNTVEAIAVLARQDEAFAAKLRTRLD